MPVSNRASVEERGGATAPPLSRQGFVILFFVALLIAGCRRGGHLEREVEVVQSVTPSGEARVRALSLSRRTVEVCYNGLDDNHNGPIDEGCNEPQGEVQFSLSWDDPGAELDLSVSDPGGQVAPLNKATSLGLVKSLDCPRMKDSCLGKNREMVYLETSEVPSGTYTVRVRLARSAAQRLPVVARLGVRLPGFSRALAVELPAFESEAQLFFEVRAPEE